MSPRSGTDLRGVLRAIAIYLSESAGAEGGLEPLRPRVLRAVSALREARSVDQSARAYKLARTVLASRKRRSGERAVPARVNALMLRARHALEDAYEAMAAQCRATGRRLTMAEEEFILSSVNARNQEPVVQRKTPMPVSGFDPEDEPIRTLLFKSAIEPVLSDDVHRLPVVDQVDVGGFSRFHEYSCRWCLGLHEKDPCRQDCPVSEFCGGRARVRGLAAARADGLYLRQLDRRRARAGVYARDDPRMHAAEFRRLADALVALCAGDQRAPEQVNGDGLSRALNRATNDDPAVVRTFLESLVNLLLVFETTTTAADDRSPDRRTAQQTLMDIEEVLGLEVNPSTLPGDRADRILNAQIDLGGAGQRDAEKDNAILADAVQRMRGYSVGRKVLRALLRERHASYRQRKPLLDQDIDRLLPVESA